jgi:hypothetical protein
MNSVALVCTVHAEIGLANVSALRAIHRHVLMSRTAQSEKADAGSRLALARQESACLRQAWTPGKELGTWSGSGTH